MKRLLLAGTAVLVLGGGIATGVALRSDRSAGPGRALTGGVTVFADTVNGCEHVTGFDDVTEGATVSVADAGGTPLATTVLGRGRRTADGSGCRFAFGLDAVDTPSDVVISVGDHRGVRLTPGELETLGRKVELRLGAAG